MADVSRETPPEAGLLFPNERLELAERFVELLATDGVLRGLIGPREGPRLWSRHVMNCASVEELVPPGASVCDLGSGAGLPGLVLALARPDLRVTLVEPLQRRCAFLEETVETLGLPEVEVVRARAEALHGTRVFDVVTARALAPLERLLDWALPLVARPAGRVLAMKGESAAAEVDRAAATLTRWGCAAPEVITVGKHLGTASTTVVRVMWASPPRGRLAAGPPGRATTTRRQQSRRRQVP